MNMHHMNHCLVCVSCSGRRGQPVSTAKARAPHPGLLLVPEQSHLWPSSSDGGFLPPVDPLPVCLIEEKHNPTVSLSLSLSPPFLKSSPRALPRTDLGPLSVSRLCEAHNLFRFEMWVLPWPRAAPGCPQKRLAGRPVCRHLIMSWGWTDLCVLTEDFSNTQD